MEENQNVNFIWRELKRPLIILGGFIFIIWTLEIIDQFIFGGSLDAFGIRPRRIDGLWGILWAPFLHGGLRHVLANTGPILVLGVIILASRRLQAFIAISITVILVGGIGTWLVSPDYTVHLGASGLIFGYFGFLLLAAYFERSCRSTVIAAIVLLLYSGIIWGVLPQGNGVSWQMHLFGFVGGGVAAYLFGHRRPKLQDEVQITLHDQ